MKSLPRFTPVVHVTSPAQAGAQSYLALAHGAGGIFLIDHRKNYRHLLECYRRVRGALPDAWIGINFLDLRPLDAVGQIPHDADALWLDDTGHLRSTDLPETRNWKVFAGCAFKYQRQPVDLFGEAALIADRFDVTTTSGDGTGMAASPTKIAEMKRATGARPLALASGVTSENINSYMPFVDCFLVASWISWSHNELDARRIAELAALITFYDSPEQAIARRAGSEF